MDKNTQKDLIEALYWIRVTERQIGIFVESLLSVAESGVKDSMPALGDGHFLLISAAQAERTLQRAGHPLNSKIAFALRKLRNIHEHWEQHKDSFASEELAKTQSGKGFAEVFPGALPWRYAVDATGTWISTLRLEDLWKDLLSKEAIVGSLIKNQGITFSADTLRVFPKRESRVLGFTMLTQSVTIKIQPNTQA